MEWGEPDFSQPRTIASFFDFGDSGGSSSSGSTSQKPTAPPWLMSLLSGSAGGINGIPSLSSLYSGYPLQGTAPLTPEQFYDINQFQNLAANPFALMPGQQNAMNLYGGVTQADQAQQEATRGYQGLANWMSPASGFSANSGPNSVQNNAASAFQMLLGGPNVSVPYGQQVFNSMVAPQVESQAGLAGLGNSGALGENLAMAGEAMALPMAEQGLSMAQAGAEGLSGLGTAEQGNSIAGQGLNLEALLGAGSQNLQAREASAGGLASIGDTMAQQRLQSAQGQAAIGSEQYSQGVNNLTNALTASGLPQQYAQQVANALYNQQSGQNQMGTGIRAELLQMLSNLFGQNTTFSKKDSGSSSLGFQL